MSTGRTVVVHFALFFLYSFITAQQQSDTLKPLRPLAQHRETATDREAIPTMNRYVCKFYSTSISAIFSSILQHVMQHCNI
uniref:Secreted protein n=1 Tax=Ascaris lumbricoides TaxID=6252 RepID=A0A0M3HHP1_ASCLU